MPSFIILLIFGVSLIEGAVDESCIECICQGSTECNKNLGCHDKVCGPFSMTYAFWLDAGEVVHKGYQGNKVQAYEHCASQYHCAKVSVAYYVERYQKDCNGDGIIDCRDYAKIHRLGPVGCYGQLDDYFSTRFNRCYGSGTGNRNPVVTRPGSTPGTKPGSTPGSRPGSSPGSKPGTVDSDEFF